MRWWRSWRRHRATEEGALTEALRDVAAPEGGAARLVLLVEDRESDARLIEEALSPTAGRFEVARVSTLAAALAWLERRHADIVLVDLGLPDSTGIETFSRVREATEGPVVIVTGIDDHGLAINAVRLGAQGYVVKDEISDRSLGRRLVQAIERHRALERQERAADAIARSRSRLEEERNLLREEYEESLHFGEIVGESPQLREVLDRVRAVAATDSTVLISGESGVGKELVARAIYRLSRRSGEPLVRVNCPSIPRELFESEFFGHVKGSFTGAHRNRLGRFELADGGTLFLDEVSEIPLELQAKLLRVLQEGEFERIGEEKTRSVDVRVIAATNRDLKERVAAGGFREDLYYRLGVFPIEVPPLRRRRQDVLQLVEHFLPRICRELRRAELRLEPSQVETLTAYEWPGNVRELRNVLERAVILSTDGHLRLELAFPARRRRAETDEEASEPAGPAGAPAPGLEAGLPAGERGFVTAAEFKRLQKENITAALRHAGWRVAGAGGAAELLDVQPSTLYYQIKALGVVRPGEDDDSGS